jgi:hypothetical protein
MLLRHTTSAVKSGSALTVNPAKNLSAGRGHVAAWVSTDAFRTATVRRDVCCITQYPDRHTKSGHGFNQLRLPKALRYSGTSQLYTGRRYHFLYLRS